MPKNCNFIEKLREVGLRPTKQRVKMCEVLFNRDKHGGGESGRGSSNIQFESIEPTLNFSSPENTKVEANLRTCSGTSIGGNETSFIDKGYAPLSLT